MRQLNYQIFSCVLLLKMLLKKVFEKFIRVSYLLNEFCVENNGILKNKNKCENLRLQDTLKRPCH